MTITVKCFATLRQYAPADGQMEVAAGDTVEKVLLRLDIPLDEVRLIFVNGVRSDLETGLAEGDRLGVFPPVGGG
ncbi:MAG: molybdopterin synthase sulfur carrier subunit [Desulfobulbus propionicus]|nr:MAG: molybdopterin synthase sulfur carrier subunit [Desulfobulbus propionicus]